MALISSAVCSSIKSTQWKLSKAFIDNLVSQPYRDRLLAEALASADAYMPPEGNCANVGSSMDSPPYILSPLLSFDFSLRAECN